MKIGEISINFCRRLILGAMIIFALFFGWESIALAGMLGDRISEFPEWEGKPALSAARGDLVYPQWMAGEWRVTSILVEARAPLAPDLVTPGFEGNRDSINQPVRFDVRFGEGKSRPPSLSPFPISQPPQIYPEIVADRAYNGLNIARAVLGDNAVVSVRVDPEDPNRQVTKFPGDRDLISVVTSRGTETPQPGEFIATEIAQQIFEGESTLYLNEVETTTDYHLEKGKISADQITAIYLSPQDPNYFQAAGHPVALYRYQLKLEPLN